jgi:hypothetical protein
MWMQLALTVSDLQESPSNEALVAASLRQLLRAHDAGDRIAIWSSSGAFFMRLRLFLHDLLAREPAWDSHGTWFEGLGLSHRILYDPDDRTIRIADAMVWDRRPDVGARQWAGPFEAESVLTADMSDLASYTIRFGDLREHPEEDFQTSLLRIERDLEAGLIDWAFEFRREAAGVERSL